ncbi:CvfB family protein [Shouchella shacheensis]|uniref:CvfB family protein n=1 Tax=Shouchella shacheensis TaxID=1649580 RepID=UPI00073FC128|nr:S1-like domain-containing RNA-binding protein [Shouchella shacheensis]
MLAPGISKKLEVVRKAAFGYFLSDGTNDILLHNRECTREVEVGEIMDVFLYHDHQNRLSATMEMPIVKNEEMGWLKVVSVKRGHGVFLDNGVSRDLFVSMDELPTERSAWPAAGDHLFVSLTWDKKGRLMGKLVHGAPVTEQAKPADASWLNREVHGTVYHFLDEGAVLLVEEGPIALLHMDEAKAIPRLGESVQGRVQFVREDGRVNMTQRLVRTEQQKTDAENILEFLQKRKGAMPYSDKSTPNDIEERFGLSKAAFKRALGKLMKEGKVEQKDGWTYELGKE